MIWLAFVGGCAATLVAGGLILFVFWLWVLKRIVG